MLYRTNFQSRQIEEALRRYGREYVVLGGFSFYQRAEVKDALAYLKALASPHDSVSLLRIINTPARGIGKSSIEQIEQYAREHNLSVWSAIGRMLDEKLFPTRAEAALRAFRNLMVGAGGDAGLGQSARNPASRFWNAPATSKMLEADKDPESESRLGNLNELVNAACGGAERGETVSEFLDHAALVSDTDQLDERAPVSLLTLHNAKGLEFPIVFLAGHGRGAVSAHAVARFQGRHGRGAAAVLCRNDARGKAPVPDLGALSAALGRRRNREHPFRRDS